MEEVRGHEASVASPAEDAMRSSARMEVSRRQTIRELPQATAEGRNQRPYFLDGALSRPPPDGLPVFEGQPAGPLPPLEPPPLDPPPFEPPAPFEPFATAVSTRLSRRTRSYLER